MPDAAERVLLATFGQNLPRTSALATPSVSNRCHALSATPPANLTDGLALTPLVEAIEHGDRSSVSRVLADFTPDERRRELTTEAANSGGRLHGGGDSVTSRSSLARMARKMLPIFHAASSGKVDVFTEVHDALRACLPDDEVSLVFCRTCRVSCDLRLRFL